ncbi:hypothetical protein DPSP01_002078 [Paraphaeosphaeria sporulosa]
MRFWRRPATRASVPSAASVHDPPPPYTESCPPRSTSPEAESPPPYTVSSPLLSNGSEAETPPPYPLEVFHQQVPILFSHEFLGDANSDNETECDHETETEPDIGGDPLERYSASPVLNYLDEHGVVRHVHGTFSLGLRESYDVDVEPGDDAVPPYQRAEGGWRIESIARAVIVTFLVAVLLGMGVSTGRVFLRMGPRP